MTDTPRFTDANLYRAGGRPEERDIVQDSIGDCYLVSSMGALAQRQPDAIRDAIHYDPKTGNFQVRLYQEESTWLGLSKEVKPVIVEVTQAEILDNIHRRGGSTMDNTGKDAVAWPAVIESAYAKLHDAKPSDGLGEGYQKIDGGWAQEAMLTLTGSRGDHLSNADIASMGADAARQRLTQAMADGRPVTLSTDPERTSHLFGMIGKDAPPDGLVDDHVYMVDRIYKDKDGTVQIELRNPWGNNSLPANWGEGKGSPSPTITVKLDDIVEGGGLESINIGPAPAARATDAKAVPAAGKPHHAAAPEQVPAAWDARDPGHRDYALHQSIDRGVAALNQHLSPEQHARLTGGLFASARESGMEHADRVVMSSKTAQQEAGATTFAIQGALDDPTHRRAQVDTAQALATPVEQSLMRAAAQVSPAQAMPSPQQDREQAPARMLQ